MKKISTNLLPIFCFFVMAFFYRCSPGKKKNTDTVSGLISSLRAKAPEENVKAFDEVIKELKEDPDVMKLLGLYAFLNRHVVLAAWCYARAEEKTPDDFVNLSNLGLCLQELYLADKEKKEPTLFQNSLDRLERAVKGAPGNAAAQNNLGYALYRKYLETKDEATIAGAETALRKAVSIEPDNEISLSHLAQVLAARQKNDEAVALLNKVHGINPFNGVFIEVINELGDVYKSATAPRRYCDSIDFKCQKCRGSIIGGLEYVQCEMDQQSANMDCKEGKPYKKFFKCGEIGDSPWMIPGLHSGVCILTPFGKLCVLLQGDGTLKFKLEFKNLPKLPNGMKLGADGSFNPDTGQSDVKVNASVSVNILREGDAVELANQLGIGPGSIKVKATLPSGETELKAQVGGMPFSIPLLH